MEDLPGWCGFITRVEAEKRLMKSPVGTYLLREGDGITMCFTFHLEEENHAPLHSYVMTLVEEEEKISDLLILQTNRGWSLYRDNPDLQDPVDYSYYSSPRALIESLKKAKQPIF